MTTQAHTADIDLDLDLDDTYARVNDLPLGDSDKPAEQTKCDTVAECKVLVSPQTSKWDSCERAYKANISCQINFSLLLFLSVVLVFTAGINLYF